MISCLTLCLAREKDDFVAINYAVDPQLGFPVECGNLTTVTRAVMEQEGLNLVLRWLDEFPNRVKTEKSELERRSKTELASFNRAHKHVTVSLQRNDELWLGPMHFNRRGGMESRGACERVVIPFPTKQETFIEGLFAAFERAE